MNKQWKETAKICLKWILIVSVLIFAFNRFGPSRDGEQTVSSYSDFMKEVKSGQIEEVVIEGRTLKVRKQSGETPTVYAPPSDPHMIDDLIAGNVEIKTTKPEEQSVFMTMFISWFPMLLLIAVWIIYLRKTQGGGIGGPGNFSKSKAKMIEEDQIKITFADVAGCEEAKEEVEEVVDFLKDPQKFQRLGGNIPHGILMVGPPGTGKTLLGRAIAGEAKVKFFIISGSDFVEMFVGVGAARVRDMFEQAKQHAPCIIFIDEIDAVGRQRGAGLGGGHDEREQTLNQLLVEMDGFGKDSGTIGVIVIAATNRPDVLDKALLRPGRFDRQVTVGLPDVRGREQILKVHLKKVPCADDVKPIYIAKGTPGFSGADLANIVNEAALFAARKNQREVTMANLEQAKDKIIMGVERHTVVMGEKEKKLTAYHEAGHAIVGRLVPSHDPVYKISIMPRGRALGVTMFLPETDQYSASKEKLDSMISSLYGGRIAEEMIFGWEQVTTGAQNDIERATELATNMVTKWGLSQLLGPVVYSKEEGEVFLGRSVTQQKGTAESTATTIAEEIRAFIDRNYERAEKILKENIDILHSMADALMKYETINKDQIDDLMERRPVRVPADWVDTKKSEAKPEEPALEVKAAPENGA